MGRLYAVNTLGGAFGCLAASMVLIGTVGLAHTVWIASAVEIAAALLSGFAFRAGAGEPGPESPAKRKSKPKIEPLMTGQAGHGILAPDPLSILAVLALLTGFAALSY
ncbi:MAG: hypothetical protein ABIK28_19600, partial [Planctomycetota bacterium]